MRTLDMSQAFLVRGGQGYEAGILLCARFNLTLSASREGRAATEILVDGFQLS